MWKVRREHYPNALAERLADPRFPVDRVGENRVLFDRVLRSSHPRKGRHPIP